MFKEKYAIVYKGHIPVADPLWRRSRYAHDVLTAFMEKHGWAVERHYLLDTAWVATFSHGNGGRVLGVNSEMDALPGVGHACGHNLIAIAGVAVALAIKAALIKHNIPGKVGLLGTPGI
jgi:metal-dependent amidase/aminoacylase/carboxypeptidase family protein